MICEIITIGTEIMMGSTLNTNNFYLSKRLTELGIEIYYHTSVNDNEERLKSVIETALDRADLIITTGGLGPTKDDMTKEIVSKTLGLDLNLDVSMETNIINMFKNRNIVMTTNNKKQAFKPAGSVFIKNEIGTAPGIYIENDNKKIILLPGPPREMELMFENGVVDLVKENLNIITKSINTVGIGESTLESRINELNLDTENTSVLTFAKSGTIEIKIISKNNNKKSIEDEMGSIIRILENEFCEYIYGYDNVSLESLIIDLLNKNNLTLALCESITGGNISSKLTKISGASKVFDRSLVTYSNLSKVEELGVKKDTLKKYGPVSEETACEMVKGLFKKTNADICLSITGLAGPGGALPNKPIGLVYMGLLTKDSTRIFSYHFNGDRSLIIDRATVKALDEIRKVIQ